MFSWIKDLVTPSIRRAPHGVDVASYQGPPGDWKSEAGRISWAAVKLTEYEPGGVKYVNPDAAADWDYLGRNDLGRVAYMYGHPSASAADSVSLFITEVRKLGLKDRDAVALDLEEYDGKDAAEVSAWAQSVMRALANRLDRTPLFYTYVSFSSGGYCAGLGHYPLWISNPSAKEGHPQVPAPWKTWAVHQYVAGGNSPIDRDVGNYASKQAMFKALGKPEGPDVRNLGGSIVGAITSVRWPDGVTVVAGLGRDGYVQTARFADGKWGDWRNVSGAKALGAPGLISFGDADGHLYYTDSSHAVIELTTSDAGANWS